MGFCRRDTAIYKQRKVNMSIKEKYQYLTNYNAITQKRLNELDTELKGIANEIDVSKHELLELTSLEQLTRAVADFFSSKYIEDLQYFVNQALVYIFDDESYSIRFEVNDKKLDKDLKIYLVDNIVNETELSRCGDGVRGVVSLMMQIYILDKFNKRYIFMDEALTEIADIYVDNLFNFLNKVVNEMKFNILLISHDVRFYPYFKNIYVVDDGNITKEV